MDVLTAEEVVCVRGGRRVFGGLSFRLQAGGAVVLTGPNGSGKSSLMRLIAGLLPPAGGSICWNGVDVAEDREGHNRRLHYLGHLDALKPALTVAENLRFWAHVRGVQEDFAGRIAKALTTFGLLPLADLPARFLSRGQQRRLSLARLVATTAPLWLLDEPRAGLDHASCSRLDGVLAAHRARGGMVVVALHGGGHPLEATVIDLGRVGGSAAC